MSLSKFLLKSLLKQPRRNKGAQGFTLLELLVGLALTFLIITPLMSLVISLMGNDRQEQAKVSSQQEIQAALDYIAQDLQQAIYVYDAAALNTGYNTIPANSGIKDQIPPYSNAVDGCNPGNCIPVLAFWKRKYFDRNDTVNGIQISSINDSSQGSDRFLYSLVVYYLIKDPTPSPTWSKVARIGRFEVKDGILDPTNTDPNTPPSYLLNPDAGFKRFDLSISANSVRQSLNSWQKGSDDYAQKVETLVDYIDDTPLSDFTNAGVTTISLPAEDASGTTLVAPECDAQTGTGPGGTPTASRVPPDSIFATVPPLQEATSFYACVTPVNSQGQSVVQVSLRGSALPRLSNNPTTWQISGGNAQSQLSYRPSASVRVAVRGLLGGQGD